MVENRGESSEICADIMERVRMGQWEEGCNASVEGCMHSGGENERIGSTGSETSRCIQLEQIKAAAHKSSRALVWLGKRRSYFCLNCCLLPASPINFWVRRWP